MPCKTSERVSTASLSQELLDDLERLAAGPRRLLGIVGAPGSGKSTLAASLVKALGERAQVVPMDGFHLAQQELVRLGRAHCKGAPDTFDAAGYTHLLRRLRTQAVGEVVYAPDFRREIEEPVAAALPLFPQTALFITEGNYLLLADDPAWSAVAGLLDEVWYLQVDPVLRLQRLCERHMRFGRTHAQALSWIAQTDEPNARRIEAFASHATRQVVWNEDQQHFETR